MTRTAEVEETLSRTAPDLLAYFARRVATPEDAADLVGEVMLTAWRCVDSWPRTGEEQRMWLFGIARNALGNQRRTAGRRRDLTARLRDLAAAATRRSPEGLDEAHAVRDAVLRLPEPQRELVMLVHWDGFTLVEAAGVLGINASTARSRYQAARSVLHAALQESPV